MSWWRDFLKYAVMTMFDGTAVPTSLVGTSLVINVVPTTVVGTGVPTTVVGTTQLFLRLFFLARRKKWRILFSN